MEMPREDIIKAFRRLGDSVTLNNRKLIAQWARLGVLYGVAPARQTPDVEAVLIDTSHALPTFARLLPTTVSWLARFERLVCRHRLARMAAEIIDADASAALGLLLDFATQHTQSDHLRSAIALCRAIDRPRPLFEVDRRSAAFAQMAEEGAADIARHWGLWTAQPALKPDALRPATWLMTRNPALRYRAIFGGNLRASVIASLLADPDAGRSESQLARACGVTRKALRDALEHLAECGLVRREPSGSRMRTILERTDPLLLSA